MPVIREYKGKSPKIGEGVFIAENSVIIGDVEIGPDSSVWYGTVIRGDVNYIRIGKGTNIQDNSVVHVTHDTHPTIVGDYVTVGHRVILHGCTIGNYVLVGMGAVVMDGVVVEDFVLIGAGALLTPNKRFPSGVLVAGVPAKIVRDLRPEEIELIKESAMNYINYKNQYLSSK
ncbi:gamma carbonic anhydrase family protein [Thermocrinis minervae]|uniref:Carbonic anhydrase or acetyltransferase, isoleucine patch superfamily n=1 Tax=Thermocrinis minervae TaxID=381751 RepID=A0A1M6REM1_9AQUI|nr:gamma carbonic anhydrase family protein [Thermocrinis minervae]SHK30924.1 Carbonic anhydrase or acetyltransferase, isoleucine patch superfamily [Thermocrinis minervae]